MRLRALVVFAGILLAGTGRARAETIFATPPGAFDFLDNLYGYCDVVNVSDTQTLEVTIELRSYGGAIVTSNGPLSLAPNTGTALAAGAPGAWCKVILSSGSKKSLRAGLYYVNATNYTIYVPATSRQ